MGFSGTGIFNNDHCLNVLDRVVDGLMLRIGEGLDALVQIIPLKEDEQGEVQAAPPMWDADGFDAHELLILLDEKLLAPLAILGALCNDPIVQAQRPALPEAMYWHDVVRATYGYIQCVERQQPPRQEGTLLANLIPGQAQEPAFWVERLRTTEEMFTRLAGDSGAWEPLA